MGFSGPFKDVLQNPLVALGAAASVPLVVSSSEQYGSKQLGGLVSALLANTSWMQESLHQAGVPAAAQCLDRLAAMLSEASQALGGVQPDQQGAPAARHLPPAAAAALLSPLKQQLAAASAAPLYSPLDAARAALPPAAAAPAVASLPGAVALEAFEGQQQQLEVLDQQLQRQGAQLDLPAAAKAVTAAAPPSAPSSKAVGGQTVRFAREVHDPAAALAAQHPAAVAAMRKALAEAHSLPAPPARFSDAELMRYAVTKGYLRARTPEQRHRALQQGAAMAAHTADWLHRHPFATCEELAGYAPLLRWEGADAGGRPVLHISIGKAVNECRGPAAVHFANAIVTQLQHAVEALLGDDGQRPERIVVVMDCSGVSVLGATRIAGVFKAVCSSLNQHFPMRLHELVLLDLPPMLTWLVASVKKLVHPDTRDKVRVVRSDSGAAHPVMELAIEE